MTPVMMIPSPLASARPNPIAVATTACVLPEAWACTPLVANVKAVCTQEAGQGGKVRNRTCQAEYASVTTGLMPGVTDQDLRQSKAWLANRRAL
jgi:hypothetical protein